MQSFHGHDANKLLYDRWKCPGSSEAFPLKSSARQCSQNHEGCEESLKTRVGVSRMADDVDKDEQAVRQQQELLQAALRGPMPKFYANSFALVQGSSDLGLLLLLNNQPVGTVNMSYISAKSLLVDLSQVIDRIEKATGQTLKTMNEINSDFKKSASDE
jgi:hypothetical protein